MPLHLLGKKSWNVYNQENISRVKRDEAQAKALEEEDERRMQEVDSERRIAILRGEKIPTPPPAPPSRPSSEPLSRPERGLTEDRGFRKRRRLAGEDDTDRDIRFAREDAEHAETARNKLMAAPHRDNKNADAPLLDSAGHINLFPNEGSRKKSEKNKEAEAEAEKSKRSYEDQYTMRFSNAAGLKQAIGNKPWYSSSAQAAEAPDSMPEKNVWGNEDPLRKEREKARMDANDPLAAMKRGVRQLRATEQERKRWNDQRKRELEMLKSEQRASHRRKRSKSIDSLEGFQLDVPADKDRDRGDHRSSHRRNHDRHRRDRSRDRHRDRSSRHSRHSSDNSHRHRRNEDETRRPHRSDRH